MLRAICDGVCSLALAGSLSGSFGGVTGVALGSGVKRFGPGAGAFAVHGSIEAAVAAYKRGNRGWIDASRSCGVC